MSSSSKSSISRFCIALLLRDELIYSSSKRNLKWGQWSPNWWKSLDAMEYLSELNCCSWRSIPLQIIEPNAKSNGLGAAVAASRPHESPTGRDAIAEASSGESIGFSGGMRNHTGVVQSLLAHSVGELNSHRGESKPTQGIYACSVQKRVHNSALFVRVCYWSDMIASKKMLKWHGSFLLVRVC